jgi:hypothetical protein
VIKELKEEQHRKLSLLGEQVSNNDKNNDRLYPINQTIKFSSF